MYQDPTKIMDKTDVGLGFATGFASAGTTLIPSIVTNVGGALLGSDIKGENPNASMVLAAGGTVFGYGVGKAIELPFDNLMKELLAVVSIKKFPVISSKLTFNLNMVIISEY